MINTERRLSKILNLKVAVSITASGTKDKLTTMANKPPSFIFYSADYYMGTRKMTQAERGAYMDVLCMIHQTGHLSREEVILYCEGKEYPRVFEKLSVDNNGLYFNQKLNKVMEEKLEYIQNRNKNLGEFSGKSHKEIAEIKARREREKAEFPEKEGIKPPSTQNAGDIPKAKARKPVEFKPPTLEEVEKYFIEHNFPVDLAKRAWEGYDVANWIDSQGKQIKNWKQKMIQVWFDDKHKKKDGIDRGQHPGQVMVTGNIKAEFRKS
jgi:hypothetical protein